MSPKQVLTALRADPAARLVDVRTPAEWSYVGLPDLESGGVSSGHDPVLIPWQIFPTMHVNTEFVEQLKQSGLTAENHLYFLCRSGVRSLAAAAAAEGAGYTKVYNVLDGFEGPPDAQGHRGQVAGWKADGLPWRQR